MKIPGELRYTKSHEWVRREGGAAVVGISEHAQQELRDVVFVEVPAAGRAVKQGEAVAVVESVKAAFDIYAPVSGTIAKANSALAGAPQLVNQDCYGQGWFFAITPSNPAEIDGLLTASQYEELLKVAAH
jgi:glycine cleavage system H protein